MNALVIRVAERHITAPLIGHYSVVHRAAHDAQHLVVKEEVWNKARWLKGHREKVAMRAAVRLMAAGFEISEQNRPKRASAGIDHGPCKMFSEYAIAPVSDLDDLVLNPCQFAFSAIHQSGKRRRLIQLFTNGLHNARRPEALHGSYLLGDEASSTAIIVAPQRDIQQYLADAARFGLQIRHVFLTHFHAGFVAGHLELRDRCGSTIHLGSRAQAEYDLMPWLQPRISIPTTRARHSRLSRPPLQLLVGIWACATSLPQISAPKLLRPGRPLVEKLDAAAPTGAIEQRRVIQAWSLSAAAISTVARR